MAKIQVSDLTFCYEGSFDNIFEKVSFSVDTDWKLGLIGRNGKGKTTLLRLLMGELAHEGRISSSMCFDYFPYYVKEEQMNWNTVDVAADIHKDCELWKICRELALLKADEDILWRPFGTLSHGERTKVMLAILFSRDNYFLLIDEPTNHLDMSTREVLRDYLNRKRGFILVSHDRWLLDSCIDHVLVLERSRIVVEKGNFSSWWDNKRKKDEFELGEDEKLRHEIDKLKDAARRSRMWAEKVEKSKIGFDPVKEHDRFKDTRCYLGEKSRRMQQRRKNLEQRQQKAIAGKEGLLKNLEQISDLKVMTREYHKECCIRASDVSLSYGGRKAVEHFTMELKRGDRIFLQGKNGCGKSSVIKAILRAAGAGNTCGVPERVNGKDRCDAPEYVNGKAVCDAPEYRKEAVSALDKLEIQGELNVASGLEISYISQDTSHLKGSLDAHIDRLGLDKSRFRAILRQLDFDRIQFEKNMENYSEGQKKKVLIAGSLLKPAHLYIWDEPLNYIDVFSRMQIEKLILDYGPTMLIVEHDRAFGDNCATTTIQL